MELTEDEHKQVLSLGRKKYTPHQISEELCLPLSAVYEPLRKANLVKKHEDITNEAIEILRHDNLDVAEKLGRVTSRAADKALEMVNSVESADELSTLIKVTEVIARVRGMIPKEAQTNIQVNNIIGFEFVSIEGQENLVQTETIDTEIVN